MNPLATLSPFVLAALGGIALLGGCKVIDQRTFDRTADKPPVLHVAVAHAGAGAPSSLVTIGFPATAGDWTGQLKVAVDLAISRKPNVVFTVQSVVPATGDLAGQADRLIRATADGRAVADAIEGDGVDRGQIELVATTDPSVTHEEIRVLVR